MSTSHAPPVQKLVTELSKLPGVGSRTAQRLAFHILRASDEDATALAESIREVKERIRLCEVCFNLTDEVRCRICEDPRRDQHQDPNKKQGQRHDRGQFEEGRFGDKDQNARDERFGDKGRQGDDQRGGEQRQTVR